MIELRRVQTDADVDAFLRVRAAIDPEHPLVRDAYLEHVKAPGRVDLLALADGDAVGTAFVEPHHGNLEGSTGYVSVRVLRERRRQGIGSELFRAVSERSRESGWSELCSVARHDDADTLAYLSKRGFAEALRMQELSLELAAADVDDGGPPEGVEIVPLGGQLERRAYEITGEIYADLPEEPVEWRPDFDEWRRLELPGHTIRACTLAAVAGGEVVGYATLHQAGDGAGIHGITGVRRAWRGRGVALALKREQLAAARHAGLRELRTTTAFQNAPMLRVNERLGYRRGVAWIHLRGPLLDGAAP
jgi:GNAT superfamily N-acetyltransferase